MSASRKEGDVFGRGGGRRANYRLFKQELCESSRPRGCGDFEDVWELLDVTTTAVAYSCNKVKSRCLL